MITKHYRSFEYVKFLLLLSIAILTIGSFGILEAQALDPEPNPPLDLRVLDPTLPTVNPPAINPPGGSFSEPVTITLITSVADTQIFYTTDGTIPTKQSIPYLGPFTLQNDTTIRAKSFKTAHNESALVSAGYSIGNAFGQFYVAPSGTSNGDGSIDNPWDLNTALAHPTSVEAGATIWLRGGIYGDGTSQFQSQLSGKDGQPIKVRQYPNERATIDGFLTVFGQWVWYQDFEIMSSVLNRWGKGAGGRAGGIDIFGSNTKFINLIIHDGSVNGIGAWTPAENIEVNGCLIYFNGYLASDRAHGHGIYTQNDIGTKIFKDNIIFNNFKFGTQVYTSNGSIEGFDFKGNVFFFNGSVEGPDDIDLWVGSWKQPGDRIELVENFTYSLGNTSVLLGVKSSGSLTISNNYFAGGAFSIGVWEPLQIENNTFYGSQTGFSQTTFSGNTYYKDKPTSNQIFLRPNEYGDGRAHIIIYNWEKQDTVEVDMSGILTVGTTYEIRDAQNFFGSPIISDTYNGETITIPMKGLSVVSPVGDVPTPPPHSGPEFGTFILISK